MVLFNLGKPDGKNETFIALNAKSMILIIPGIILGHYLDEIVDRMNLDKYKSVTLQTILNIVIIYTLHKINQAYTSEFQLTLSGLFFSALFFGMQTNYIKNLKNILK